MTFPPVRGRSARSEHRAGESLMSSGGVWSRCSRGIGRAKRAGGPGETRGKYWMASLYVLRTGCQWKAVPQGFGSPSSLHRYFQERTREGCSSASGKKRSGNTTRCAGIDWGWQSLDGAMTKGAAGWGKIASASAGGGKKEHRFQSQGKSFPSYRVRSPRLAVRLRSLG